MKNNLSAIALGFISVLVLSIALLLSRWDLIGILLGYGIGYINAELLMRATTMGADMDINRLCVNIVSVLSIDWVLSP